uniref:Aquaporin TIP1 n=1 Tax=Robinia pseudoacacia TaxID=35938 RepID=A0A342D226_ROBPS|nr:aquaporin TIP1 [Robinia pseudoacacia]
MHSLSSSPSPSAPTSPVVTSTLLSPSAPSSAATSPYSAASFTSSHSFSAPYSPPCSSSSLLDSLFPHLDFPLELELDPLWCLRSLCPSVWCTLCTPQPLFPRRVLWELLPPSRSVSLLALTFWRVGLSMEHPFTRLYHLDLLL